MLFNHSKLKRAIIGILSFFPVVCYAQIEFTPPYVDFGQLRAGELDEMSTRVIVQNKSDNQVGLTLLDSSCACTTSTDFPNSIAPKEKREFTVRFKKRDYGTIHKCVNICR